MHVESYTPVLQEAVALEGGPVFSVVLESQDEQRVSETDTLQSAQAETARVLPEVSDNLVFDYYDRLPPKRGLTNEQQKAEHVELGKTIQAGREALQRLECDDGVLPMTLTELHQQVQMGEQAKRILLEGNLRLVTNYVLAYSRTSWYADIVQECNMGLMYAVETYDYRRDYAFSTHAMNWIRKYAYLFMANDSRTIRIPVHMHDKVSKVRRTRQSLETYQDVVTDDDIAKAAGMSAKDVATYGQYDLMPFSLSMPDPYSLQTLGEQLSPQADPVGREVENIILSGVMQEALAILPGPTQEMIRMKFGIDGPPQSNKEIGAAFGMTHSAAGLIVRKALKQLREHDGLRGFLT